MAHRITLIPGDGIGPEVTDAVVRLLARSGLDIEWERETAGATAIDLHGKPLPQRVLDSIVRNRVALKGPIGTPIGSGFPSVNVEVRRSLGLYANLRPVASLPGLTTRFDHVDLVVVRENTEDLYSGLEHEVVPGVVESLKIITAKASERIARFAFSYAQRRRRRKVTAVHKANIMKLGDGLFLDSIRKVARDHQDIEYAERIVDAACMQLVMDPGQFDVLLLPNLYGDIVSDLCAGLVGGLGLVPSANLGDGPRRIRGGARHRTRHRRAGHGQPDGAAAVGPADAALPERGRDGRPPLHRPRAGARRRPGADARPRRHRHHTRVHGRHREADGDQGASVIAAWISTSMQPRTVL